MDNGTTWLNWFLFICFVLLFFASLRNLISSFLRMEGMVNLNITDTQRASNLSKNLSSIVLHKTGASNKIFPQKFDENLTLERKLLTKYMSTRDLWQFYFLSAISAKSYHLSVILLALKIFKNYLSINLLQSFS